MSFTKVLVIVLTAVVVLPGIASGAVIEINSLGSYPDWRPANTSNGGTVSITGTMPRDGDGSLEFTLPQSNSRADITFGGRTGFLWSYTYQNLGLLSELSSMSFDWYRDSASTAGSHFIPTYRVFVRDGNSNYEYVWEAAYNGYPGNGVVDQWVTQTISPLDNWYLANQANSGPYNRNLSERSSNAYIYGFSISLGSGWGYWHGFVDNISWTMNGETSTYNFNLTPGSMQDPIPEPATLTLLGLGMAGIAYRRLRNRA